MKTNVITLEEYDNLASVLEKISWSAPGRILMVFPDRGQILRNEIEFLQIIRKAQDRGANLAIVTRDDDLLLLCRQRNISTFSNLRKAQKSRWKKRLSAKSGRPEVDHTRISAEYTKQDAPSKKPLSQGTRIGLLVLGIISFLLILGTFLPGSELKVSPEKISQEIVIAVEASEEAESIGLTGSVPIHRFSVITEGSLTIDTTGTAIVADGTASGIVELQSTTSEDIFIPAGSIIQPAENDEIIFLTQADVLLSIDSGTTQNAAVEAKLPGTEANTAAATSFTLQGIYTKFVKITNPDPISGGSVKETKAATEENIQTLRAQLIAELEKQGRDRILSQIEADDLLLNDNISVQRILLEEYFPEQSTPSSQITLTMEVEFQALVIEHKDFHTLAEMVLNTSLPEGYIPQNDSLVVLPIDEPQLSDKGHYNLEIVSRRMIESEIEAESLKLALLSRPRAEISSILTDRFHLSPDYTIHNQPDFWPLMPFYPFRIEVVVE